jgi:hypothetical protein
MYSEKDMKRFDTDFQNQLKFNICETRDPRKKFASLHKDRASRLRDVDLDIMPTSFACDTTDHHTLPR